ncbi:DNA-binding protein [Bacillus sp. CH30_1T]|uniref:DNA-binding protein n=1 Tax=Bacillus sp. CH30_1T TaxID=2604836 RepID=UPI0011EFCE05|nr:DNA-binding protein [Bacillus sp. CH30_1T]KAA0562241.1 DNA-binding protein [Bacillus sp. CH30_1T]
MDLMWLAIGMVGAAFFIAEGLKNFNNPNGKSLIEKLDEDDEHELIKESDVHHFIGISKEDARVLLQEHPDVPHLKLNGNVYYPKTRLRQWLLSIGD